MSEHVALLQIDIVDSTRLGEALGDTAMSTLGAEHDRFARDLLVPWRGREIDKSDGFLLLFDAAADALGYALAYHRGLASLQVPLRARAGLHTGTIVRRENASDDVARGAKPLEIEGVAKPVTARVMSLAEGGQTLVTGAARASLENAGAISGALPHLRSQGHWRMKGIEEPIELFEIAAEHDKVGALADSVKAYRVLRRNDLWVPMREIRHSLPAERDAFIGRDVHLHGVARRFEAGARLVSVLGMGGTGKTRLAQRFGWAWLGEYPGGVWFCDLSQARSLDGAAQAVATGLDVPLGQADPIGQLGSAIAGRGPCLVILDNFEQLTRFAEATIGHWLDRAAEARFIVTSREVLGIVGEEALALPPMPQPEGSALFLRRAMAVRRDFSKNAEDRALVDQLVRLLDGLPLAIELAAARVRVMPPRLILERMSERFKLLASSGGRLDRHATLRATFDWSWDLLSPPEKAALAQLSVFEGGATLAAAEATIDLSAWPDAPWVVDVLQSLFEKSLVTRRGEDRFDLLSSLQQYAANHLATIDRFAGSGSDAVSRTYGRHFRYFASIGAKGAVAESCADLDNLVVACRRAPADGDRSAAVGCLEGALAALERRGPFGVAIALADNVGAVVGLDSAERCRVGRVAGRALWMCGRFADAEQRFMTALVAAREAEDDACVGYSMSHLGNLQVIQGEMTNGEANLRAAATIAKRIGDFKLECETASGLARLHRQVGNMAEARSHYEAALLAARIGCDRRWEGASLGNLAMFFASQGLPEEAFTNYEAALAVAAEIGDRPMEGNNRCNLGFFLHLQGKPKEAHRELIAALFIARLLGQSPLECAVLCNLGVVFEAKNDLKEAQASYEAAVDVASNIGDGRSKGEFLKYLGLLHAKQSRFDIANACFEESLSLLTEASDKLNVALLLCVRAEAACLEGEEAYASVWHAEANAIAQSVEAKQDSELSLALRRTKALIDAMRVVDKHL